VRDDLRGRALGRRGRKLPPPAFARLTAQEASPVAPTCLHETREQKIPPIPKPRASLAAALNAVRATPQPGPARGSEIALQESSPATAPTNGPVTAPASQDQAAQAAQHRAHNRAVGADTFRAQRRGRKVHPRRSAAPSAQHDQRLPAHMYAKSSAQAPSNSPANRIGAPEAPAGQARAGR
jgi:hypothetical protein